MTVYNDTFTDWDGQTLASHVPDSGFKWEMISGAASAWTIVSNATNIVGTGSFVGIRVDDDDYEIVIDMTTWAASSSAARITFRAWDDTNYYFLNHFDSGGVGYMQLARRVAGADSVVKQWALPAPGNVSGLITIRCVGERIDVTAAGVTDGADTPYVSTGRLVGLRSGAYTSDTLKATSYQVTTLPTPPSTYLDTFTQATSGYVETHKADSGFTWTVSQQMVYQVGSGLLYGPTSQTFKPVWFMLDSAAFTATFTLPRFGKMCRIAFRLVDRANYLYFRHDGLGNVVLGIRSGIYGSETDAILDTWTIPDVGDYFVATVVLTNSGPTITIDINGTSHTSTTIANRTATGIGFDSEPGAGNLQLDQLQVDTVEAPPLPPGASWDPAAFSGGSPITGYTLHMRTLAGADVTAEVPGTASPLGLDLPAAMLTTSGWFWVTAKNAAGTSQASAEVLRAGPSTFHGFSQAEWDAVGVNDNYTAGVNFAQSYTAVYDFMLTSVNIYGDNTGCTVELHEGPLVEQFNNGTPGALLATVTGDTQVLEFPTPMLITAGTQFVIVIKRPAAIYAKWNTPPAGDPALIIGKGSPDDEGDGTYYLGTNAWVAMQLGLA